MDVKELGQSIEKLRQQAVEFHDELLALEVIVKKEALNCASQQRPRRRVPKRPWDNDPDRLA
jgi:hypothetical protein